jgi:hypothetical protein
MLDSWGCRADTGMIPGTSDKPHYVEFGACPHDRSGTASSRRRGHQQYYSFEQDKGCGIYSGRTGGVRHKMALTGGKVAQNGDCSLRESLVAFPRSFSTHGLPIATSDSAYCTYRGRPLAVTALLPPRPSPLGVPLVQEGTCMPAQKRPPRGRTPQLTRIYTHIDAEAFQLLMEHCTVSPRGRILGLGKILNRCIYSLLGGKSVRKTG